jgi:hypothetical protein
MKNTTANQFNIINVLDIENHLFKHQQRLKTIYRTQSRRNHQYWEG